LKNTKLNILYTTIIFITIICASCNSSVKSVNKVAKSNNQVSDSDYVYHFRILDSAAAVTEYDTIVLCCRENISFMEKNTKVGASSPGTFAGKLYFTKSDLKKWHEWYKKNN
jgi:hypothetical protein